jgi:hypothetical protein
MNDAALAVLGVSAGVINLICIIPYLRDIFHGKTKPERATWWVWLVLAIVALFAQLDAGGKWVIVLTISAIITLVTIAVLSVPYGYGRFHRRDFVALLITALGVGAWLLLDDPLLAILVVISVDAAGFWLTLNKTWQAPYTETMITWLLAAIAAVLAVLSVGSLNPTQILYPLYSVLANSLLAFVILWRRKVLSHS